MELPDKDGRNDGKVHEAVPLVTHHEDSSEGSMEAHANDTMKDCDDDTIVQMAHRVAATLDFASQGLREPDVSAPCEGQSSTSAPQIQNAQSSTQDGNPESGDSRRHAEDLPTHDRDLYVDISERELFSLFFAQGASALPRPNSSGRLSSTQNFSAETSGNHEAVSDAQNRNESGTSNRHAVGVATQDIAERELLSLFFCQGASALSRPSSSGHLSSSQNFSEEAIGNVEATVATHSRREEESGTQAHNSEASILTANLHTSDVEVGATAVCDSITNEGATDSQGGAGVEWTPGPRLERPDYDEILGLRRLMRQSRRAQMRQRIEELFSVYVSTVSSGNGKMKVKDLPVIEINEQHFGMKCSVCLVEFVVKEEVYKLGCGHIYHKNCIIPWLELSGNCPLCRTPVQECTSEAGDGQGDGQGDGEGDGQGDEQGDEQEDQGADVRLLFNGANVLLLANDNSDDSISSFSDSSDSDFSISYD